MPNYLYNDGVELPALPTWDKKTYPYAVIIYKTAPAYKVYFSTTPFWKDVYVRNYSDIETVASLVYTYDATNEVWVYSKANTKETQFLPDVKQAWANHDIHYSDNYNPSELAGTIYLAASYPINPETGEEIYDYDPIPVGSAPEVEPKAFMNGYLTGQKVRVLRRKLTNTEDIIDTDFTITGQLDVTYSHDESKALLGDRSVFGEQYGAGTFIVSEVCAMTYRDGHLIVEGDLYEYDTAESSETTKPESE